MRPEYPTNHLETVTLTRSRSVGRAMRPEYPTNHLVTVT